MTELGHVMGIVAGYLDPLEEFFYYDPKFQAMSDHRVQRDYDHATRRLYDLKHSLDDKPYLERGAKRMRYAWYRFGELHRDHGPAIIELSSSIDLHKYGYDGLCDCITLEYYIRGIAHRVGGPALVNRNDLGSHWIEYGAPVQGYDLGQKFYKETGIPEEIGIREDYDPHEKEWDNYYWHLRHRKRIDKRAWQDVRKEFMTKRSMDIAARKKIYDAGEPLRVARNARIAEYEEINETKNIENAGEVKETKNTEEALTLQYLADMKDLDASTQEYKNIYGMCDWHWRYFRNVRRKRRVAHKRAVRKWLAKPEDHRRNYDQNALIQESKLQSERDIAANAARAQTIINKRVIQMHMKCISSRPPPMADIVSTTKEYIDKLYIKKIHEHNDPLPTDEHCDYVPCLDFIRPYDGITIDADCYKDVSYQ